MPYYRLSRYTSGDTPAAPPIEPVGRVSTDLPREFPDVLSKTSGQPGVKTHEAPEPALKNILDTFMFSPDTTPAFLEPYEQLRTQWSPYEKQMLATAPSKVLIGYEGVLSEKALALGLSWARRYHAQVIVAHVSSSQMSESKEIEMLESLQSVLQHQKENSYFKSYPPKVLGKISEKVSTGLVQLAQEHRASLIVLATHGRAGGDKLRHGSVAEEVLKDAPCPVLIGQVNEKMVDVFHPRVIAVPIDFSPFAYRAIAHSIILSRDFGSHLYLFHTHEEGEVHQTQKLQDMMRQMNWQSIDHELVVESGDVVTGLTDFCTSHQADLIVMGTHRVDYNAHTYANSLTSQVITHAPCPVLIVHPQVTSA